MKLWKSLQNPVALVFQGFLVGGFIFFAFQPLDQAEPRPDAPAGESILSGLRS